MSSAPDAPLTARELWTSVQRIRDLGNDTLEDVGGVDLVFDVIGGDVSEAVRTADPGRRNACDMPSDRPDVRPVDGLVVDFVVEADRGQLSEIVQARPGRRLRTNIGKISSLDDAIATFNSTERRAGKTVIRVLP